MFDGLQYFWAAKKTDSEELAVDAIFLGDAVEDGGSIVDAMKTDSEELAVDDVIIITNANNPPTKRRCSFCDG